MTQAVVVNGHRPQTIVSAKLSRAFEQAMAAVEASHGEASEALMNYWWNLYTIRRDNLWRAKYNEGQFKDWLSDLSKESFGPSKTDFYDTMKSIDLLKKMGKTEDDIKPLLGKMTTAMKSDLKLLFEKNGKGNLLPDVQAQLTEEGLTPSEFIDQVVGMSASDQRSEVRGKVIKESIYFLDDFYYDEINGRLLVNVQHESNEDGILYRGTLVITCTETTEPRQHKGKGAYLPEKIADYVLKRFGLSER